MFDNLYGNTFASELEGNQFPREQFETNVRIVWHRPGLTIAMDSVCF